MQFGFTENHSTGDATFLIKEAISYACNNGGHLYACFMDASKAFDFLDHGILFSKMMELEMPPEWIRLLMSGYEAINLKVRWNNVFSHTFPLQQGVRQGDVLSPALFSVYLDELLEILQQSGCGFFIGKIFVGCVVYVDDIVLLSTSATDL